MSLSELIRLLARKWLLLLLVPLALSVSTYYFGRNLPRTYASDTTIYTGIASGYSLTGNAQADYNVTNNAFDNLVNLITVRSTKKEVIYQLLATHLWQVSRQPKRLGLDAYQDLRTALPAALRQQLTDSTPAGTLLRVRAYATANTTNLIYRLLNSSNSTYSLESLDKLLAARIGASDLVRVEYESYDPEICRYTLELVTEEFLRQSLNLRQGQTASVTKYYEAELLKARERLARAESTNLAFNRNNNIINYEAQSKNVAGEKEALAAELTQVSQQYAGAQAALRAVNNKLGGQQEALLSSRQVIAQRERLSRLNAALADQQLFGQQEDPAASAARVKQLQAEASKAAQQMQRNVDEYYTRSNTAEGIPNRELLDDWVQNMVEVEATRAKLGVMNRRLREFEREYQRMAPLGATLKRIEREIDLAEKAYLTTLNSLNDSKASQQNTQLMTSLKIIDPPNLPTHPKNSKLLMLVLLSGAGGFVFVGGLVIGLGLLDKSLKNKANAARQTGLPVAGQMLDVHAPATKLLRAAQQRSLGQLVRHILLKANAEPVPQPFVVGVFSVEEQEGKTTLCRALAARCHDMGVQTLALYPEGDAPAEEAAAPSLFYPPERAAVHAWPLEELIQRSLPKQMPALSGPDVQVVFVEFPALREGALPLGVLKQLHLVFLTVPATRAWRLTDHETVETLRAATTAPVELVLSGVAVRESERAMS